MRRKNGFTVIHLFAILLLAGYFFILPGLKREQRADEEFTNSVAQMQFPLRRASEFWPKPGVDSSTYWVVWEKQEEGCTMIMTAFSYQGRNGQWVEISLPRDQIRFSPKTASTAFVQFKLSTLWLGWNGLATLPRVLKELDEYPAALFKRHLQYATISYSE